MRQKPEIGQVFLVPLDDASWAIGQVIAIEPQALNSITCVFSGQTTQKTDEELTSSITGTDAIAALFTTPDLLQRGHWRVCGKAPVLFPKSMLPNERFRNVGWVGAKIVGSGIVVKFLNAYHGLALWDDWHDPKYLDGLLVKGVSRPKNIRLKAEPTSAGDVASAAPEK